MAYWIHQAGNGNRAGWRLFYCDTSADINNLPTSVREGVKQEKDSAAHMRCSVGSHCLSLEGSRYILNSNDTWEKMPTSSGSSGEIIDAESITNSEIDDLLKI